MKVARANPRPTATAMPATVPLASLWSGLGVGVVAARACPVELGVGVWDLVMFDEDTELLELEMGPPVDEVLEDKRIVVLTATTALLGVTRGAPGDGRVVELEDSDGTGTPLLKY